MLKHGIGHLEFYRFEKINANYLLGSKKETYNKTPNLFLNRNQNVDQGSDSIIDLTTKISSPWRSRSVIILVTDNVKEPWYCFCVCAFEMIPMKI